jgi:hypothetical protein
MDVMLAPCGVDCGICSAYLREKNHCAGCLADDLTLSNHHCSTCTRKYCIEHKGETYCYSCDKFPCRSIKGLEKRYTEKYGESPIDNGRFVEQYGMEAFIALEKERWICKACGSVLNVHRSTCDICNAVNPSFPVASQK